MGMIEKRNINIIIIDNSGDFGRVQTTIETELNPFELMHKILEVLE